MKQGRLLSGLLVLLGFAAVSALAQTKALVINQNNGAPLQTAVDQIEKLSGVRIIYEGTRDDYRGDYEDISRKSQTPENLRLYGPPSSPILGPKPVPLTATISVDAATGYLNDLASVEAALQAVIAAYNSGSGPGAFALERHNGFFLVKPTHMRDENGTKVETTPLLSTPITLPTERRPFEDTIYLIFSQIKQATGFQVRLAGYLYRSGMEPPVTFGADNEPAYLAILRLLENAGGQRDPTKYPVPSYTLGHTSKFFGLYRNMYGLVVHRVNAPARVSSP